jgi:hypothetical protein
LSEITLFGDSKVEVTPGGGPELTIQSYTLFGDVWITDRASTGT